MSRPDMTQNSDGTIDGETNRADERIAEAFDTFRAMTLPPQPRPPAVPSSGIPDRKRKQARRREGMSESPYGWCGSTRDHMHKRHAIGYEKSVDSRYFVVWVCDACAKTWWVEDRPHRDRINNRLTHRLGYALKHLLHSARLFG